MSKTTTVVNPVWQTYVYYFGVLQEEYTKTSLQQSTRAFELPTGIYAKTFYSLDEIKSELAVQRSQKEGCTIVEDLEELLEKMSDNSRFPVVLARPIDFHTCMTVERLGFTPLEGTS